MRLVIDDPHIVVDVIRIIVSGIGLWLAAMLFRFAWLRWKDRYALRDPDRPHPAMYAAFGMCLALVSMDRIANIGHPLNLPRLILSMLVIGTTLYGIWKRWRFVPPGKR